MKRQTYESIEIILVDSGSFDGTVDISKKFCDKIIEIKKEEFTFGFAINIGIQHAAGDLICIVSAHTLPVDDDWIKNLVSSFIADNDDDKIAMSYGRQLGVESSNFSEINDLNRDFRDKQLIQNSPRYFCSNANSMILKKLWEQHPFDESLSGLEDIEWSKFWLDKGYRLAYEPDAGIYHIHNETPVQIKRRFFREAIAAKSIGILTPLKVLLIPFSELYNLFKDILILSKQQGKHTLKECLIYRYNKVAGNLKVLTKRKQALEDYSQFYAPLEYKAVEISKPSSSAIVTRNLETTRPNEVLIRIAYTGVCETDMEVYKGTLGFYRSGRGKYPIVPGHEYSGVVMRTGAKIKSLNVGDPVIGRCILSCGTCDSCLSGRETACDLRQEVGVLNFDGSYAEYINLESRFVHKLPPDISLNSAASVEPMAVVLKGLRRAGLEKKVQGFRQNILVTGGGPIGHLCARICEHYGHNVTVVEINKSRSKMFSDTKIKLVDKLPELKSFNLLIETTGIPELAENVIVNSPNGSQVLLLGLPYGESSFDLESIVSEDKKIIGSVGSGSEDFRKAIELLRVINMEHFNQSIYPLEEWQDAWAEHKTKEKLKVKIQVYGKAEIL